MEILQLIETKLRGFGVAFDMDTAQVSLDEVDQTIKNYCHIDCIPTDLLYVRANMVVDYIRYIESNKLGENGQLATNGTMGSLTSIKAGDVQYNFAENNKSQLHNAHMVDLDSLVNNYVHQLNAFRRLP